MMRQIEAWRPEYNCYRHNSCLNDLTPMEFVAEYDQQSVNL